MERPKIGELLVAAGVIDTTALEAALEKQRTQGGRLGKILLGMGALDEEMLVRTVARQLEMPVAWLRGKQVKAEVLSQLPRHVALRHRCLPVMLDRKGPETLLVAMEDPSDAAALDEVAIAAGRPVRVVLAAPSELDDALARHYPAGSTPSVHATPGPAQSEPMRDGAASEPAGDEPLPSDDEPELLLTDPLGETGQGEPELRHVSPADASSERPAAADPLDLGGDFDPGARPFEHAESAAHESADASDDADADTDPDPELAHAGPAHLESGDDLGLDIPPDEPALRAGDSLDEAIDEVRGADASLEPSAESDSDDAGVSLFGDDPLEATLPPRPARADGLPRDAELRAVALLLIEAGLLDRDELAARLLALRGDEKAGAA